MAVDGQEIPELAARHAAQRGGTLDHHLAGDLAERVRMGLLQDCPEAAARRLPGRRCGMGQEPCGIAHGYSVEGSAGQAARGGDAGGGERELAAGIGLIPPAVQVTHGRQSPRRGVG